MRFKLGRLGVVLLALVVLVAATGCSKVGATHWRRNGGFEYELWVVVPASNPYKADNQEDPDFVEAVREAADQWDQHPDVTVELLVVGEHPELGEYEDFCKLNHGNPATEFNCIEVWSVPQSHMESAHNGAAGVTIVWGSTTERFNGPANDPSRIEIVDDWSSQGANAIPALYNAACHEMGHAWGLGHADMVDLDQDPETGVNGNEYQPPGPCQEAVPDRDEDDPYDLAGFDWQNVDTMYDTCVNDGSGPAGSPSINPNGVNNVDTIGYDDCGGLFRLESGEPGPVTDEFDGYEGMTPHVDTDDFEDIPVG